MSDALPLPARPNLEQYKKLAKDLQRACKSGEIREWAARWIDTLARSHFSGAPPEIEREIAHAAGRAERKWRDLQESNAAAGRCTLGAAQFFLARAHGFASWPKFAQHLEALASADSPDARFEAAAGAIVNGDRAALQGMLREHPELIRARSPREHHSTLLHYVSANGVEDFRQKTPGNIVEIAKLLLDSGADVNAESDAYRGRSTTLGLTATSWHPCHAGVQIPLLELLLERGASIDGPDGGSTVNDCLHNGRGEAAEFLANRGARLDLEGAAGAGRLDVVRSFFHQDGTLRPPATEEQLLAGFNWACEFGRTVVVEFLLQQQIPLAGAGQRETGLHWAAFEGHAGIVKLLLERGAPFDVRDRRFEGTPLDWALYGWGGSEKPEAFYEVVALLARAGAKPAPDWYEGDPERQRAVKKLRADPRMQAALRGAS